MEKKIKKKRSLLWRIIRNTFLGLLACVLVFLIGIAGINVYIVNTSQKYFTKAEDCSGWEADCIIVLGASVLRGGTLSSMLEDRVLRAIELYESDAAQYIMMSGDSAVPSNYDEVTYMKRYAVKKGVPDASVLVDPYGTSTYDTMKNMQEMYKGKKVIIVTQRYHLYRAVYLARKMGIDAYGVPTEAIAYSGQDAREIREILARVKDFFQ